MGFKKKFKKQIFPKSISVFLQKKEGEIGLHRENLGLMMV